MATDSDKEDVDWLMSSPSPQSSALDGETISGTGWLLASSPSAHSSKPPETSRELNVEEPDYVSSHDLRDPYSERDMEVDPELPSTRNDPQPEGPTISEDVLGQLNRITTTITQLHQFMVDNQRVTDARLSALDESIRAMNASRSTELHDEDSQSPPRPIMRPRKKDSSANYARRCIRKHMKLTFGFNHTDALPEAPSAEEVRELLCRVNRGASLPKPYRVDWTNTPTSVYNLCVENAFAADFWASVMAGQYNIDLIPAPYQDREGFIKLYRRHLTHLRKCWATQQDPPLESQKVAKAKHYARNSRIGTTFRNRRDAARYLPPPDSAKVFNLIKEVGTPVRIFPGLMTIANVNRQLFNDLDEVRKQKCDTCSEMDLPCVPTSALGTAVPPCLPYKEARRLQLVPLPPGVAWEQGGKQTPRQTVPPVAERGEAVQGEEASSVDGEIQNDPSFGPAHSVITWSDIDDEVSALSPELIDLGRTLAMAVHLVSKDVKNMERGMQELRNLMNVLVTAVAELRGPGAHPASAVELVDQPPHAGPSSIDEEERDSDAPRGKPQGFIRSFGVSSALIEAQSLNIPMACYDFENRWCGIFSDNRALEGQHARHFMIPDPSPPASVWGPYSCKSIRRHDHEGSSAWTLDRSAYRVCLIQSDRRLHDGDYRLASVFPVTVKSERLLVAISACTVAAINLHRILSAYTALRPLAAASIFPTVQSADMLAAGVLGTSAAKHLTTAIGMELSPDCQIADAITQSFSRYIVVIGHYRGFVQPQNVDFMYPPTVPTAMYPGPNHDQSWREGPVALRQESPSNASVLLHISTLLMARDAVDRDPHLRNQQELRRIVLAEMNKLEQWRMSQWIRQQRAARDPNSLGWRTYDTNRYFASPSNENPVVTVCAFLVVTLNILYQMTLPACRFSLKALQLLLKVCSQVMGTHAGDLDSIVKGIPADLSTAIKRFDIEPDTTTYACCPECFALYPPRRTDRPASETPLPMEQPSTSIPIDPLPFFHEAVFVNSRNFSPFPSRLRKNGRPVA
ncbi:hypothetical protein C8Q76DRAFT_696813 [Earliella scabrosa]|nr:hypothetical protein C8Q76DRAFT_696813 [Earliella scabrosa]